MSTAKFVSSLIINGDKLDFYGLSDLTYNTNKIASKFNDIYQNSLSLISTQITDPLSINVLTSKTMSTINTSTCIANSNQPIIYYINCVQDKYKT